jgi:hypothetical protein
MIDGRVGWHRRRRAARLLVLDDGPQGRRNGAYVSAAAARRAGTGEQGGYGCRTHRVLGAELNPQVPLVCPIAR